MSDQVTLERDGDVVRISGRLDMQSVPAFWERSRNALRDDGGVVFDLAGVTRTDSAGLALLVDWIRVAREHNKDIKFINLPDQLLAIARVSGVDGLIPRGDAG